MDTRHIWPGGLPFKLCSKDHRAPEATEQWGGWEERLAGGTLGILMCLPLPEDSFNVRNRVNFACGARVSHMLISD